MVKNFFMYVIILFPYFRDTTLIRLHRKIFRKTRHDAREQTNTITT